MAVRFLPARQRAIQIESDSSSEGSDSDIEPVQIRRPSVVEISDDDDENENRAPAVIEISDDEQAPLTARQTVQEPQRAPFQLD